MWVWVRVFVIVCERERRAPLRCLPLRSGGCFFGFGAAFGLIGLGLDESFGDLIISEPGCSEEGRMHILLAV